METFRIPCIVMFGNRSNESDSLFILNSICDECIIDPIDKSKYILIFSKITRSFRIAQQILSSGKFSWEIVNKGENDKPRIEAIPNRYYNRLGVIVKKDTYVEVVSKYLTNVIRHICEPYNEFISETYGVTKDQVLIVGDHDLISYIEKLLQSSDKDTLETSSRSLISNSFILSHSNYVESIKRKINVALGTIGNDALLSGRYIEIDAPLILKIGDINSPRNTLYPSLFGIMTNTQLSQEHAIYVFNTLIDSIDEDIISFIKNNNSSTSEAFDVSIDKYPVDCYGHFVIVPKDVGITLSKALSSITCCSLHSYNEYLQENFGVNTNECVFRCSPTVFRLLDQDLQSRTNGK